MAVLCLCSVQLYLIAMWVTPAAWLPWTKHISRVLAVWLCYVVTLCSVGCLCGKFLIHLVNVISSETEQHYWARWPSWWHFTTIWNMKHIICIVTFGAVWSACCGRVKWCVIWSFTSELMACWSDTAEVLDIFGWFCRSCSFNLTLSHNRNIWLLNFRLYHYIMLTWMYQSYAYCMWLCALA
jgi:hypothetical protein